MSEPTGSEKAAYVRRQSQDRRHGCHWPGCPQQVPPAMWGCKTHWFKLPRLLRAKVWAAYVPGQEQRMDPSEKYLAVAREVQEWIESVSDGKPICELGCTSHDVADHQGRCGHCGAMDDEPCKEGCPVDGGGTE